MIRRNHQQSQHVHYKHQRQQLSLHARAIRKNYIPLYSVQIKNDWNLKSLSSLRKANASSRAHQPKSTQPPNYPRQIGLNNHNAPGDGKAPEHSSSPATLAVSPPRDSKTNLRPAK